mgnify:FL=1
MVQAHRLEGTALARVAAAKQLVELKPHHLDGGEQRLQAHHENIAQHDHDQVHHRAARQPRDGEHCGHHTGMHQYERANSQEGNGVAEKRKDIFKQLKEIL